jgi:hypothetical protein
MKYKILCISTLIVVQLIKCVRYFYFFVDFLEQSRGSEFKTCFGALTHLIVTVIYELQETKDVIQLVAP